ncbi:hypothetical protein PS639_01889 [Pseudomonas fluorescens]|nr:hypothetical protein PS639_01889 [Pseudomonas fluorescens]
MNDSKRIQFYVSKTKTDGESGSYLGIRLWKK